MQEIPEAITARTSRYIQERATLLEGAGGEPQDGLALARRLAALVDPWLVELWQEAVRGVIDPQDATLLALGGYGRRQLCPHSDLDALIELEREELAADPALARAIERWMTWVRAPRHKLALATRTRAQGQEQLRLDLRTPIALLDARPLWGHEAQASAEGVTKASPGTTPGTTRQTRVARQALEHLRGQDHGQGFVRLLIQGHEERQRRHGQTVYLLEPDLKAGLGALRDLNTLHWAAMVRWDLELLEALDPERGWDQAQQEAYRQTLSWILGLRHLAHRRHERKHDRLHFGDQEALAQRLYGQGQDQASEPERSQWVERLMRQHYELTRQGLGQSERMLRRWSRGRPTTLRALDERFGMADGQLHLLKDVTLELEHVFDALEWALEHGLALDATLEQRIMERTLSLSPSQREDAHAQARHLALLTHLKEDPHQGQRLLELGVLVAMMPEFAPLWCHVQHDLYHVYTTDQHTIYCMERARSLVSAGPDEAAQRWPAFRRIAQQIRQPKLLILAALLHDIGKNRGGDHSRKGAQLVPQIGERLGLSPQDIERLAFLVREHLCLSRTALRHDLADVRIIRDLASRIRSVETLRLLTALTFCDMSTVGPQVMTDWNAALLLQLHQRLQTSIEHGVAHLWERTQAHVAQLRLTLRQALLERSPASMAALPAQQRQDLLDELLRELPLESIATLDPELLLRLLETSWRHALQRQTVMDLKLDEATGVHELIVATRDRPGTLASIAGVLSASGLHILTAQILTTASGGALDLFRVTPQTHATLAHEPLTQPASPLSATRQARLLEHLQGVLDQGQDVEALLRQRQASSRLAPRQMPSVQSSVEASDHVSGQLTVLVVKTEDRPGLLYEIAATLHRCQLNTHFSKIDSLGNKVVDTFYVEDARTGGKLDEARHDEVLAALRQTLEAHARRALPEDASPSPRPA